MPPLFVSVTSQTKQSEHGKDKAKGGEGVCSVQSGNVIGFSKALIQVSDLQKF